MYDSPTHTQTHKARTHTLESVMWTLTGDSEGQNVFREFFHDFNQLLEPDSDPMSLSLFLSLFFVFLCLSHSVSLD